MDFETLSTWADEELKSLVKVLPADIQEAAKNVAISLEEKPGQGAYDDQLDGDDAASAARICTDSARSAP